MLFKSETCPRESPSAEGENQQLLDPVTTRVKVKIISVIMFFPQYWDELKKLFSVPFDFFDIFFQSFFFLSK